MERKGLIGKETEDSDNLLYTALSNSFIQGDNLMTQHNQPTRLKQEVAETEASLKSFKEIRRGDN